MKRSNWFKAAIAVGLIMSMAACSDDDGGGGDRTWEEAGIDTSRPGYLSSVWGTDDSNIWVVGGTTEGLIYFYDGEEWTTQLPPEGTPLLNWVFGFSTTDVYAVGTDGAFIHFDGDEWSSIDSGTERDLWGVWGSSPSEVWLVGGDVSNGEPVILRWNGSQIEDVGIESDENPLAATALFKVWGIGTKTFAVGQRGLIVEWNGSAWSNVAAGAEADDDFVSLWGTSEENIVVVGGRAGARIATYNGSTFDTIAPSGFGGLNAVYMCEENEAVVGGVPGYTAAFNLSTEELTIESQLTQDIHALWMDCNTGTTLAVGGLATSPYPGVAEIAR